ncbi:type II toxin-antitoxin system VapC family toxin [Gemmatimonas aurantiaca]|uniref:type II toxin-antitoxin system VapC family toxin n=1 Tax=Gemmatimonas aurantiaca TaxID=173480 RepID=UPI00301DE5D1
MIVLDTNVVSEAMRPAPDERVLRWLNAQSAEALFLTSVTLAELYFGVAAMPAGQRKTRLTAFVDELLQSQEHRALPFDLAAARHHAELALRARKSGPGLPVPNGYIAAIAASHGFAVATRDTTPFEAAGLPVIDPWAA